MNTMISADKSENIKNKFSVKKPNANHKTAWFNMWKDYVGDSTCPNMKTLDTTWRKLLNSDKSFSGIFLFDTDNRMIGFFHYILHPSTWSAKMRCYIEDAYILPTHRTTGAITVLYDELLKRSHEYKWEKLYWMTEADNFTAQKLYNRIAKRTDWVRYEYELDK